MSRIVKKVAEKCYLPATRLLDWIYAASTRASLVLPFPSPAPPWNNLTTLSMYPPAFEKLAATDCVEFLAETYHRSLALLFSESEQGPGAVASQDDRRAFRP